MNNVSLQKWFSNIFYNLFYTYLNLDIMLKPLCLGCVLIQYFITAIEKLLQLDSLNGNIFSINSVHNCFDTLVLAFLGDYFSCCQTIYDKLFISRQSIHDPCFINIIYHPEVPYSCTICIWIEV